VKNLAEPLVRSGDSRRAKVVQDYLQAIVAKQPPDCYGGQRQGQGHDRQRHDEEHEAAPGQPGPLNATAPAHFHPGRARTVY